MATFGCELMTFDIFLTVQVIGEHFGLKHIPHLALKSMLPAVGFAVLLELLTLLSERGCHVVFS